jgi:hypothetical protein
LGPVQCGSENAGDRSVGRSAHVEQNSRHNRDAPAGLNESKELPTWHTRILDHMSCVRAAERYKTVTSPGWIREETSGGCAELHLINTGRGATRHLFPFHHVRVCTGPVTHFNMPPSPITCGPLQYETFSADASTSSAVSPAHPCSHSIDGRRPTRRALHRSIPHCSRQYISIF